MMEYGKRGRLFLLDPFWLWYYTENCSHEMRKRSTFRHIENLFYIIVICIYIWCVQYTLSIHVKNIYVRDIVVHIYTYRTYTTYTYNSSRIYRCYNSSQNAKKPVLQKAKFLGMQKTKHQPHQVYFCTIHFAQFIIHVNVHKMFNVCMLQRLSYKLYVSTEYTSLRVCGIYIYNMYCTQRCMVCMDMVRIYIYTPAKRTYKSVYHHIDCNLLFI